MPKLVNFLVRGMFAAAMAYLGVTISATGGVPSLRTFAMAWNAGGNDLAYAFMDLVMLSFGLLVLSFGAMAVRPKWFSTWTGSGQLTFGVALQGVISMVMVCSFYGFIANHHLVRFYDSCGFPGSC